MVRDTRSVAEAVLRRSGWLEGRGELIAPLLAHGRIVRLAAGQWAQAEGDEATGVLVVLSGAVQSLCKAPGDREVIIGLAGPGAALGQTVRFGGGPRLVTAICQEESELLIVSDRALTRIATEAPTLWEAVAALIYRQMRELVLRLAEMTALPPRQRLAARLEAMARRGGPVRVTQQALGEMVGLTRKTVNAHLAEFETEGLVRRTYGGVEVLDAARLRRVAET
jgi:CRP-like cAMP-binding protein